MKPYHLAARSLTLLFITFGVLSGCTKPISAQEQLENILMNHLNCHAPCWESLIPNKSSLQDFNDLQLISPSIFEGLRRTLDVGTIRYNWRDPRTSLDLFAEFRHDQLVYIGFELKEGITIKQALDFLGEPESYLARLIPGERPFVISYIFYETKGVIIKGLFYSPDIIDKCEFMIKEDQSITQIYLVPPNPIENSIEKLDMIIHPSLTTPKEWLSSKSLFIDVCP